MVEDFSLKPNCKDEVLRGVCCEFKKIRSKSLPKILLSAIALYLSLLEISPCLFLIIGIIVDNKNAFGVYPCVIIELNNNIMCLLNSCVLCINASDFNTLSVPSDLLFFQDM